MSAAGLCGISMVGLICGGVLPIACLFLCCGQDLRLDGLPFQNPVQNLDQFIRLVFAEGTGQHMIFRVEKRFPLTETTRHDVLLADGSRPGAGCQRRYGGNVRDEKKGRTTRTVNRCVLVAHRGIKIASPA